MAEGGLKPLAIDDDDETEGVSFEEAGVDLDAFWNAHPDLRPPEHLVLRELAKMQARFAARHAPIPTQGDLFA